VPVHVVGIHLGNDQRDFRVHAPGRAVVHHDTALFRCALRDLSADVASGGEKAYVKSLEAAVRDCFNITFRSPKSNVFPTVVRPRNFILSTGNFRSRSIFLNSMPTAPVAPR